MRKGILSIISLGVLLLSQTLTAQVWYPAQRLNWMSEDSTEPAIAIDSSNVIHVVWEDEMNQSWCELYYKQSADGGNTWSPAKRLTWTLDIDSGCPAIGIDSKDTIHIVYRDKASGPALWWEEYEIYHKKSTDGGTNWSPAQRLTWIPGNSQYPAIAVDSSDNIHIVWQDNVSGNYEIYYKRGITF